MPDAKAPPTRPPMLVPATRSIGIRCSSSHRMMPTCANPRALPPPKATPIRGRAGAWGSAATLDEPIASTAAVMEIGARIRNLRNLRSIMSVLNNRRRHHGLSSGHPLAKCAAHTLVRHRFEEAHAITGVSRTRNLECRHPLHRRRRSAGLRKADRRNNGYLELPEAITWIDSRARKYSTTTSSGTGP